jgi:hypothetical protein
MLFPVLGDLYGLTDIEKASQTFKSSVTGDALVLKNFLQDVRDARVSFFGESHFEEQMSVNVTDFFTNTILPILKARGYKTAILEPLISIDSNVFPLVRQQLKDKPLKDQIMQYITLQIQGLAFDGVAMTGVEAWLLKQKGGQSWVNLFNSLKELNIMGYWIPTEYYLSRPEFSTDFQLLMTTLSDHAVTNTKFALDNFEGKVLLYGGAGHNNLYDHLLFPPIATGDKIEKFLAKGEEYLAVDLIALEFLESKTDDPGTIINNGWYSDLIKTKLKGAVIRKPTLLRADDFGFAAHMANYVIFLPKKNK